MNFRKIQRQYKFNDKDAPRHKHDYSIEAIAEIHTEISIYRHHIMKCRFCNSFRCISSENNLSGVATTVDSSLPVVKLKTSHKFDYFKDLEKFS